MSESLLKNELAAPAPAALVADLMLKKGLFLTTAESCTGGLISAACTDLAGSSAWFERGFVTYSNEAKTASLGVDAELIKQHGAVSRPVAEAMARGAITHSLAQVAVAVTGVARPTKKSMKKPIKTMWLGWGVNDQVSSALLRFDGDRAAVRAATVHHALTHLCTLLR